MSWSSSATGDKSTVKAIINTNTQIPDDVKASIGAAVDRLNTTPSWGGDPLTYQVHVETNGHCDNDQSNATFRVQRIPNGLKPTPTP